VSRRLCNCPVGNGGTRGFSPSCSVHGVGPLPPADVIQVCLRPRCQEIMDLNESVIRDLKDKVNSWSYAAQESAKDVQSLRAALTRSQANLGAACARLASIAACGCTANMLEWSEEDRVAGLTCTPSDRCSACRCTSLLSLLSASATESAP
jgi:hypothetical protein